MERQPITGTRSLMRYWRAATDDQKARGLQWYPDASDTVRALIAGTPYTFDQGARVMAALSPQVKWGENVKAAAAVIDARVKGRALADVRMPDGTKLRGYPANHAKAWRILDGDLDVLRGPKVIPFYRNITGDPDNVTVDVWACRAYDGTDVPGSLRKHREIAAAYRRAAKRAGVCPRDFQAVIWTVVRESWQYANGRKAVAA